MPVIVAGVRIAAVTTVGLVTITALIGLGGFGHFILRGLREFFSTLTLLGSVLSVALALVVDAMLLWVERRLTPWARTPKGRTIETQPSRSTTRARAKVQSG
jgi:osmoprotectant transport system permease protein